MKELYLPTQQPLKACYKDMLLFSKCFNWKNLKMKNQFLMLAYWFFNTSKHSETNYYSWEKKSVLNFSTYLEDEYNFNILNEKNNLNLGWNIDFRKLLIGEEQNYQINGAKATYTQDNDLTEELLFLQMQNLLTTFLILKNYLLH